MEIQGLHLVSYYEKCTGLASTSLTKSVKSSASLDHCGVLGRHSKQSQSDVVLSGAEHSRAPFYVPSSRS